ncbi:MAG: DUF1801 domain-containing protein [Pseudomonadota bacterium]
MTKTEIDPDPAAVTRVIAALTPARAAEAKALSDLMQRLTGAPPRLWGGRMIGFGRYDYTYKSGRSGTWFLTGFGISKARLSIYIMSGFDGVSDCLARVGPHKRGVSCLYLTRLDRADPGVLETIISRSVSILRDRYPNATEV